MKKNKEIVKKMGAFRVSKLLDLAKSSIQKNTKDQEELAKRYIKLARQINKHYRTNAISKKDIICKKCNILLIPGINSKVRISNKKLIYICKNGHQIKLFLESRKT
ncbi:MAG: hypothetical protein QXD23_03765 [Candidatus Micrarchaeaceae archaeon]